MKQTRGLLPAEGCNFELGPTGPIEPSPLPVALNDSQPDISDKGN